VANKSMAWGIFSNQSGTCVSLSQEEFFFKIVLSDGDCPDSPGPGESSSQLFSK
jgi:hypothetical protein